ncbi:uncharacterized protein LOC111124202 isoform X11 [Crassostrea virginica]
MSHSAPWSYQHQSTDPGGVKLFNPAHFGEQPNQPSQFSPSAQDASSGNQPAEVFNGQPEQYNTGQDPAWNWNYSQSDPSQVAQNPNIYGQMYDPSQSQAIEQDHGNNGYYFDQNTQQWLPVYGQYDQTQGYDPSHNNFQDHMMHGQQPVSSAEFQSGNFTPNYNQYQGNYTDPGGSEILDSNNGSLRNGHHLEQVTDQAAVSADLDQTSGSQGMSGFFQNDDYETESNTETSDQGSSLQTSVNHEQPGVPTENVMKSEISNESLQTVNFSTGSLDNGATLNSGLTLNVQQVTEHVQQLSVSDKSLLGDFSKSETNTQSASDGNDTNQSAMHGQVHSTGNVSENVSGGSPHSDDQQGLSDWEVVPPESSQMLEVPGGETKNSRDESVDDNVKFFIGSSKNSDNGSARHTPETATQTPNNSDKEIEKEKASEQLQITTQLLKPQLTSSPNISPGQKLNEDMVGNINPSLGLPPTGPSIGGSNPFRKEKTNTVKESDNVLSISPQFTSTNDQPMPSPIVAASEDSGRTAQQRTQPQSPIMPRKESPFQPPNRQRTLSSQSSESEDLPKSEREGKENVPNISSQISGSRNSPATASTSSKYVQESGKSKRPPRDPTKPRLPTGSTRGVMSPRRIESAFQQVQKQRAKHNMSPATTLWDNNDTLPVANILLAPAAPAITPSSSATSSEKTSPSKTTKESRDVLSPVQMLINTMSEKQHDKTLDKTPNDLKPENKQYDDHRERSSQRGSQRNQHERGSSIDRELEITRSIEEKERRRESESYRDREQDYYRNDGNRGRNPRDRDYNSYYDKHAPPRRRDPYYGDERYERPRSRHSLLDEDRSSSRQGQESERPRSRQDYNRDVDRPRSRQDYGRDSYYRDRYGQDNSEKKNGKERYMRYIDSGHCYEKYDYYTRHGYYDRHAGYYDKYYKYDQRYYDDYYGRGNYDDRDYDAYRHYQESRSSSRQGYDDATRAQWDAYYSNYNRGGYGYGYDQGYEQEVTPSRMTPVKHSIPHTSIRFGPGGHLVKVIPNRPAEGQPAIVEIHDLNEMLQDNPETEELKNFPGPLVRGDTHKNDVLRYCQMRAKACAENVQLTDRDSAELLWRFLELLIKQNGTFVGTDIADLLLDGHEPTTVDYSMMGLKINPSSDTLDEDFDETVNMSVTTSDRSVISRGRKSHEEATDRFRHLLLYGRKKDALDWAMKNNLWGHALFLASKMDSRAHANVMTRFANSAMKMNDPLQTLFQLMSCRQPAAVTCVVDEKWGDWRPHLAMVLSNPTGRDIDKKSIMTLGDTLASKGFLHASHFCYMMAHVNFGSYRKKTAKMVLVGSNHSLPLSEFATNEAIQCTEIYEYANSLGNPSYYTVNFQSFKFLYACRLAENGFAQEALQYCEAISTVILSSPTLFQPILVKLVYELGNRLKYFDPQKLHAVEDEDPYWLQHLSKINAGFQDGSIQPLSGSVTPYGGGYGTRAPSTESGEVANYIAGGDSAMMPPPQVPCQQSYLTHDPMATQTEHGQTSNLYTQNLHPQEHHPPATDVNQEAQHGYTLNKEAPNQGMDPYHNAGVDPHSQWQYQQQFPQNGYQQYDPNQPIEHQQPTAGSDHTQGYYDQNTQGQHMETTAGQQQLTNQHLHSGQHPEVPQHHRHSPVSNNRVNTEDEEEDEDDEDDEEDEEEDSLSGSHNVPPGSSFDYFGAVGNQSHQIVAPKMRPRTMSETSTGSGGPQPNMSTTKKPESIPERKGDSGLSRDDKKSKESWSWWPFKGKKEKKPGDVSEMKLPDDKKPSIVWDEDKKQWINTDEGERKYEPPPPPPKDFSMGGTMQQQQQQHSSQGPPTGGPPMGNKFSLRKGKGSVPKYVDVLNSSKSSSGGTVPTSLFNIMPSSQSSPAIFSPGGETDSGSTQQETPGQSQNPMDNGMEQHKGGEGTTDKNPPSAGMPVMFNPAQFQGGQSEGFQAGPAPTRSSGRLKPGQRRMYPK